MNAPLTTVYLKGKCSLVEIQEERDVILNLLKFLQTQDDVLLTGPEIGLFKKAATIRAPGFSIDLINPEIIHQNGRVISLGESCASFDAKINCLRYKNIKIFNGLEREVLEFEGRDALLVQHAIDHLSGIVFFDRAVSLELVQKDNILYYL